MEVKSATSLINDRRSSLKRTSMIIDKEGRRRQIHKTDAMADEAMRQLKIPEQFRKAVLWLAWNRSEARFWEMVEIAKRGGKSGKIRSPGRYFIASISQERR